VRIFAFLLLLSPYALTSWFGFMLNTVSADEVEAFSVYRFIGRALAKALYEDIVIDVPFAPFFLNKMLGKSNNLDILQTLDSQLYKNLISLKTYEGSVEDLSLTFSVDDVDLHGRTTVCRFIPSSYELLSFLIAN
jgi:ubiquitin-protein ligase E3 C